MLDLIGNPEDQFSHNEAHFTAVKMVVYCKGVLMRCLSVKMKSGGFILSSTFGQVIKK